MIQPIQHAYRIPPPRPLTSRPVRQRLNQSDEVEQEEEANNDAVLQLRLSVRPNYKLRKPSAVSGQTSHIGQHSKVFNSLTLRPGMTK